jgi:CTP:molybdopterin cytidylyltransferase MocA
MDWTTHAVDTIVMASGLNRIPLYEGYVPGCKALIPFRGRASIHYVLDALDGVKAVGHVCTVGPRALLNDELAKRDNAGRYELEEGGETLLDSMMIGLQHFRSSPAVLVVSADLPLITTKAVQDFISGCAAAEIEYDQNLYVSAVSRECYTGAYARFPKPFNRFRDVSVCHGNLFLADPNLLDNRAATERINRLYRGRKNALTAAWALGWQLALTYIIGVELLHVVTIRQMASFASRRLGFGVVPILVDHPEITIDVDEPDDYLFVRDLIEKQQERLPA